MAIPHANTTVMSLSQLFHELASPGGSRTFRGVLLRSGNESAIGLPASGATFSDCRIVLDLDGADFSGAAFERVVFSVDPAERAVVASGIEPMLFRHPGFQPIRTHARLTSSNFRGARFDRVDLDGAVLDGSDFTGIQVTEKTTFFGASVERARFSWSTDHLRDAVLRPAKWSEVTIDGRRVTRRAFDAGEIELPPVRVRFADDEVAFLVDDHPSVSLRRNKGSLILGLLFSHLGHRFSVIDIEEILRQRLSPEEAVPLSNDDLVSRAKRLGLTVGRAALGSNDEHRLRASAALRWLEAETGTGAVRCADPRFVWPYANSPNANAAKGGMQDMRSIVTDPVGDDAVKHLERVRRRVEKPVKEVLKKLRGDCHAPVATRLYNLLDMGKICRAGT